jgi:uncharacterized hydrophobic protein (TIGR00271 family)
MKDSAGIEVLEDDTPAEGPPFSLYLIHDAGLNSKMIAALSALAKITFLPWAERDTPPTASRVLLCLSDESIRDLAQMTRERQWEIGVLPHPEAREAMTAMGVKGGILEMFSHYLKAPVVSADALTCNGELVFSSVVIGRVLALRPEDINRPQTTWSMLTGAVKGLGNLTLSPYKLTTAKERVIDLAALGMVALGQTQSALVERAFVEELGIADGRVSLVALAPRSIVSYLWFLLRLLWPKKFSLAQLPGSLSLIRTDRLHISAPRGMEYTIDGKPLHAKEIELRVQEPRLRLLPGPALVLQPEEKAGVKKETVRLNHTPVEEGAKALLGTHLPLFSHATEEEYRGLFVSLRESAKVTHSYQVLMILSVLLALAGMYANSAPVIIGAMILAPLMSPIVSLAMGLARTEPSLIRTSLRTLSIGVLWGLGWAVVVAWAMPLDIPTTEMTARMSPTLLDLFVAVISGVAGAYAYAKEEVAKSLAGVAIAVALVPPLSVVGIGLGWGEWSMAGGALLLLVTNLVGIALAASITFLVLGFAPFKRARAGLGISLLILLVISVPLTLSFYHLVQKDHLLEHVPTGRIQLSDLIVDVSHVDVALDRKPHLVRLVLSSDQPMGTSDVEQLKQIISDRVGEPIMLEVQSNIRR